MRKYPTINPSLTLDFSKTGRFHPSMQTARASQSYVLGEDGKMLVLANNAMRPRVNPQTLRVDGYFPSPAITNLLTHSTGHVVQPEQGTGAVGTTLGTATTITPYGASTTAFHETAQNTEHMFFDVSVPVTAGKTYVCSYLVKKANSTPASTGATIRFAQSVAGSLHGIPTELSCVFSFVGDDIVPITTPAGAGPVVRAGRVKLADGWFRIWMNFTLPINDNIRIRGQFSRGDGLFYMGDTNINIFVNAWQFEVGEVPGNYVPTSGAQATQAAEGMQLISGEMFNDTEGTLFVEYIQPAINNGWSDIAMLCTWPYVNYQRYEFISSPIGEVHSHRNDAASGYLIRKPAPAPGTLVRAAINYTPTHVGQFFNGQGEVIPRTGKSQFHITSLAVGASFSGGAPGSSANTLIKRLSYYSKALSNREMIDLTS